MPAADCSRTLNAQSARSCGACPLRILNTCRIVYRSDKGTDREERRGGGRRLRGWSPDGPQHSSARSSRCPADMCGMASRPSPRAARPHAVPVHGMGDVACGENSDETTKAVGCFPARGRLSRGWNQQGGAHDDTVIEKKEGVSHNTTRATTSRCKPGTGRRTTCNHGRVRSDVQDMARRPARTGRNESLRAVGATRRPSRI